MLRSFAFILAVALSASVWAKASDEILSARVVGVHDGDTLTLLTSENQRLKVRVWGIDAPELGQPWGDSAKRRASELLVNQTVIVSTREKDRYGRVVSKVTLSGPRDFGSEMIRAGLAWHYRAYARKADDYARMEREARSQRLGLWKDSAPVPPWDWRRNEKQKREERKSSPQSRSSSSVPRSHSTAEATPKASYGRNLKTSGCYSFSLERTIG